MTKKITISNFLKMSPEIPQASDKNQHYLIAGANPTYYMDTTGTQEEQIAPLISSLNWKQITASLDGNIVAMCSGFIDNLISIFIMTTTSQVYAITVSGGLPSGILSMGYPSGVIQTGVSHASMVSINGSIYTTWYPIIYTSNPIHRLTLSSIKGTQTVSISIATPAIITLVNHGYNIGDTLTFNTTSALPTGLTAGTKYYVISAGFTANQFEVSLTSGGSAVNTSGSQSGVQTIVGNYWTGFLGGTYTASRDFLEPFLEYCMVSNISQVNKISSSYSFISGIDLGNGFVIKSIKNYNDKYLAIIGEQNSVFTQNYLFLWNGIDDRYNYSCKIPGKFIDIKVIDGTLYMAVLTTYSKTSLYYLKGTNLVELLPTQYSTISTSAGILSYIDVGCLFNYNNNIGVRLTSNSELTYPLLINGSEPSGKESFILSSGNFLNIFTLGSDGLLYSAEKTATVANLYYYPATNTSFQPILYKSQWIPVKNLQGLDIWYDTPPASGTDKISVTVYGDGENIITGTQTITLDDITPTNYLNKKRTRLDVKGYQGDKVKIVITTTNASTWRPIIRTVDLITK